MCGTTDPRAEAARVPGDIRDAFWRDFAELARARFGEERLAASPPPEGESNVWIVAGSLGFYLADHPRGVTVFWLAPRKAGASVSEPRVDAEAAAGLRARLGAPLVEGVDPSSGRPALSVSRAAAWDDPASHEEIARWMLDAAEALRAGRVRGMRAGS